MNLFSISADLQLDKKAYEDGLDEAEQQANKSGSAIGGALGFLSKATVAGIVASATAVGGLVKSSISEYAEYQQILGGVNKLYGTAGLSVEQYAESVGKSVDEVQGKYAELEKAQKMVLENAQNAYKTAGMSTQQYMETATSFSASLINSLAGDTVKSAEQTDVAMRAIADNYNTFGGDMQMIQNAYMGFAKGNYMMLDNLKLGYGGTKTEMERLIADANAYAESMGQAGDLTINSFSDIVTAIDLVQQKQGIAGTTAREATETISGSLLQLKSSWQNLVAGLADPDADIGKLIDNVIVSIVGTTDKAGNHVKGFLDNIIPTINKSFEGVIQLVSSAVPKLVEQIPALLESTLPQLIQSATNLFTGLVKALPPVIKILVAQVPTVIKAIIDTAVTLFPQIVQLGGTLIASLVQGITELLPEVSTTIADTIKEFAEGLPEQLPIIIDKALTMLQDLADALAESAPILLDAGITLIMALAEGLMNALPTIIEKLPTIVSTIANIINDNAPKLISTGFELIGTLVAGIINAIPTLVANLPKIIGAIMDVMMAVNWMNLGANIITGIGNGIKSLFHELPNALKEIGKTAVDWLKTIQWKTLGKDIIDLIVIGVKALVTAIPNALKAIGNNAVTAFKNIDWKGLGKNIVLGLKTGIQNHAGEVINSIKDMCVKAWDAVKSFFGIHSPSRKMMWIGEMIDEGWAKGIDDNRDKPITAMKDLSEDVIPQVEVDTTYSNTTNGTVGGDLYSILTYIASILPSLANSQIVLDTGVLVGQTAPQMNVELGKIIVKEKRSV